MKGLSIAIFLRRRRLAQQRAIGIALVVAWAGCGSSAHAETQASPSYAQEIRPILAAHCFQCHGPDEGTREADLRLDLEASAHLEVIVPGSAVASEMMRRVDSDDPSERMPPDHVKHPLSSEQIELLRRWVDSGGAYESHWAFEAPVRPTVPVHRAAQWPRNPIDAFVYRRLLRAGLEPSPEADRYRLVRRLFLDLIGLPPTPAEADAFVNDSHPDAYERLVERLLASPHYGERWARRWLDLARYSDTNGYEKDNPREMWHYRDWVIDAINQDMPFDQFTVEQIAGDMLPDATLAQRVATGFHRNTMVNEEGGIDPQEFRYLAVVDRVATTGTTWLGLTIGCAQCHTHKFDPISHTDFFGLFAMLNGTDDQQIAIPSESVREKRARVDAEIGAIVADLPNRWPVPEAADKAPSAARQEALEVAFAQWQEAQRRQRVTWRPLSPVDVWSNLPTLQVLPDGSVLASGDVTKNDTFRLTYAVGDQPITAIRLETLPDERLPGGGPGRQTIADGPSQRQGNFFLSEVHAGLLPASEAAAAQTAEPLHWKSATASFVPAGLDAEHAIDGRGDTGWTIASREGERHSLVLVLQQATVVAPDRLLQLQLQHESFYSAGLGRFRVSVTSDAGVVAATGLSDSLTDVLRLDPADRSASQTEALRRCFLLQAPELREEQERIAELKREAPRWSTALVLAERQHNPRVTRRRHRGEYLQRREVVPPNTPSALHPLADEIPRNRLGLAHWLVSHDNPLAARVFVNRSWEAFFGNGLVETSDNFGTQGSYPTHPELLDWLAAEFMDQGWSRKQLHRLIVTSATYRQASTVDPERLAVDPRNQLLARAPRLRLDAETVRDVVLRSSGLLNTAIGGPSVFPPQPPGITEMAYGPLPWKTGRGPDRYRRGMYTFNKRTAPYAAFALFDAPSGEACVARRLRSNTPLQALAMLNDRVTMESARQMAATSHDAYDGQRVEVARDLFRRCLTRPPSAEETDALVAFYEARHRELRGGEANPHEVLQSGPVHKWEFSDNTSADWEARQDCHLAPQKAALLIGCEGHDPILSTSVTSPSGPYTVRIRGTFPHHDQAQVFWTTQAHPEESPDRVGTLTVTPEKSQTYEFSLRTHSPLTGLRFDPLTKPGDVHIESIELVYGDGLFSTPSSPDVATVAAWQLAARALLNTDEAITRP